MKFTSFKRALDDNLVYIYDEKVKNQDKNQAKKDASGSGSADETWIEKQTLFSHGGGWPNYNGAKWNSYGTGGKVFKKTKTIRDF